MDKRGNKPIVNKLAGGSYTAMHEIDALKEVLTTWRKDNKVLIAVLYGSFAYGTPHRRSDIDLAIYLNAADENEEVKIIDSILLSVEREVSLLRLDDEDESPFIVQEALKGIHLVDPDRETLHAVGHRVLHDSESIRYRREVGIGPS
jgi:predicted nucleotidyltransferase